MKNPPNIETIDKSRHATLKVRYDSDYTHVKSQNLAGVTMGEITACASNYPVVFIRVPQNNQLRLVAMFGLTQGENVYYNEGGWNSTYVPLMIQAYPFMIGYDDRVDDATQLATCIDRSSPLVGEGEGYPLFDENGDETLFMKGRFMTLQDVFEEDKRTEAFTNKLVEFDLLSPLELVVAPVGRDSRRITGMMTLNGKKLLALPAAQLQELHRLNFLSACYLILSSSFQYHRLMQLRRRKVAEQIENYWIDLDPPQQPQAAAH